MRYHIKKIALAIASLLLLPSTATYASTSSMTMQKSSIILNGSVFESPYRAVIHGTTYMPIYYVDQLLLQVGLQVKWNGARHRWDITSSSTPEGTLIDEKTGNTQIFVNNQLVEQHVLTSVMTDPASGVKTTFMPIYYVQQLLNQIGFTPSTDVWNGSVNPPTWTLTTKPTIVAPSSAPQQVVVTPTSTGASVAFLAVNGATGYTVNVTDESGNTVISQRGDASPIVVSGLPSGTKYTVSVVATNSGGTGPASVAQSFTTLLPTSTLLSNWGINPTGQVAIPAQGTSGTMSAASWWASADPNFSISAYIPNANGSTPFTTLGVNQSVVLDASWATPDATATAGTTSPTWAVNSPNASIHTSYNSYVYASPSSPLQVNSDPVDFSASQPGEYVVQATWDGMKSLPLEITVGLSSLASSTTQVNPAWSGTTTLPATVLEKDPAEIGATSYYSNTVKMPDIWIGKPVEGWIPLAGTVPSSWLVPGLSPTVTVILSGNNQSKSYSLPLSATGAFSGVVACPFTGSVQLELSASHFTLDPQSADQAVNANPDGWYANVNVTTAATLPPHLQASAVMTENDPALADAMNTAFTLWNNAPDPMTGVMAISNWVAERTIYDQIKYSGSPTLAETWATATQVYQSGTGVCQDYADLLTTLYRGLGLPAQVRSGYVSNSWDSLLSSETVTANHSWVWVWPNGVSSSSVEVDPTWSNGSEPVNDMLFNTFNLDSAWYVGTHKDLGIENYYPVQ